MLALFASTSAPAASTLLSQEIAAPGPEGSLRGTLTRAADPAAPVVLIIPGSGPTDQNGNSPLGIAAQPYRLMAQELGAKSISAVRIDKRGMFASAAAVADANAVTIDDYVADIRAWVGIIGETTGTSCVWLLGHSEGGLVALATAQEEMAICGLILVATPGRPLGDVLKEQLRANPANAPFLKQANQAIDALAARERINSSDLPEPLAPLFAPALQGYLISAFSLVPTELGNGINKPILIVQGETDLQVGIEDAKLLKAAAPSADLVLLPNVNHVLKSVASTDPATNVATYSDPTLPLAPGVAEAIIDFLSKHKGAN